MVKGYLTIFRNGTTSSSNLPDGCQDKLIQGQFNYSTTECVPPIRPPPTRPPPQRGGKKQENDNGGRR